MCRVLGNSLYIKDRKKYTKISECATSFNSLYNKNNIIQDDIFNVLENYVARHDMPFDMLRYPIEDADLCACTFIRKGRMFVMVNSALPLSKQIFATAHELYHIYCYFEEHDSALLQSGSILASGIIDEEAKEIEDMEANAFAAILLAALLGFDLKDAASIGIIGAADGPTSILVSQILNSKYIGAIAVAAYSYMALVPIIQPAAIKLVTTKKERCIIQRV